MLLSKLQHPNELQYQAAAGGGVAAAAVAAVAVALNEMADTWCLRNYL